MIRSILTVTALAFQALEGQRLRRELKRAQDDKAAAEYGRDSAERDRIAENGALRKSLRFFVDRLDDATEIAAQFEPGAKVSTMKAHEFRRELDWNGWHVSKYITGLRLPMLPGEPVESYGRVAFETYNATVGGRSVTDAKIPTWEELDATEKGQRVKVGWMEGAEAVAQRFRGVWRQRFVEWQRAVTERDGMRDALTQIVFKARAPIGDEGTSYAGHHRRR